jgi:hypothetical protein
MVWTGRYNFQGVGKGVDINWSQDGQYIHDYQPWFKAEPYIEEYFDVACNEQTYGYGNTITFELDKKADKLGKVELMVSRTAGSPGATLAKFNDWEAYSCIDTVTWTYSNKPVHEITGDELYIEALREHSEKQRTVWAKTQFGFLTPSERETQFSTASTWICDLLVPWDNLNKKLPMVSLPNKLKCQVKFKPFTKCIYYSGGTAPSAPTMSGAKLRCLYYHLPNDRRRSLYTQVNTGNGVSVKMHTTEFHKQVALQLTEISSGGKKRIRLSNLKNSTYKLDVFIRLQGNVDNTAIGSSTAGTTLNLWNFQRPSRFWLEDNGSVITQKVEVRDSTNGTSPAEWGLYHLNQAMHPEGVPGLYICTLNFCSCEFVVPSKDDCFGSRNFSKYNSLDLVLEWDNGSDVIPVADCYVDIFAHIHNLLVFQNGEVRKWLI